MPKSVAFKRKGQAGEVSVNMTPMIDIVFQLIIFFILASQFASAEIAPLQLPFPHNPDPELNPVVKGEEIKQERVIVNVISATDPKYVEEATERLGHKPEPGEAGWYMISGDKIDISAAYDEIRKYVEEGKERAEAEGRDFHVEIRADKDIYYVYAATALLATLEAGVDNAHLIVNNAPAAGSGG